MKRIIRLMLLLLFVGTGAAWAQDRQISGRVLDNNGEGLPGAAVIVQGTSNGTATDVDGAFTLTIPESGTVRLVIKAIGYAEQTVVASDGMTIRMKSTATELEGTVVTAFGIRREARSLTYATQKLDGQELTRTSNPNLANSLQGKVAGLTIKQSSGMPGASSLVTIRGFSSLSGNNQPLVVVDGLPIESGSEFVDNVVQQRVSGSDGPSRLNDINPEDIESINVLKGPAASALYGLRAGQGVIVITTKRGKAAEGQKGVFGVNFYTNHTLDYVTRKPNLQHTYAQGSDGVLNQGSSLSFGPRLDTMQAYDVAPIGGPILRTNQVPTAYDNVSPFFQRGNTSNTGIGFNVGGNMGSMKVSFGHTNQAGIIPASGLNRVTTNVNGDLKMTDKFTISVSGNYSDMTVDKLPEGSNLSNAFQGIYFAPVSYDMWGLPYEDPSNPNAEYNFRRSFDNPRWSLAHNRLREKTNRFFGSTALNYAPFDWLSATYRIGVDYYNTTGREFYDLGSGQTGGNAFFSGGEMVAPPAGGSITNYDFSQNQINSNLFITLSKQFGDFGGELLLGNETYDIRGTQRRTFGTGLAIGGFENISNASSILATEDINKQRVIGNYANLNANWRNAIFLNVSVRNDRVSNLPASKRSYTYPGIGADVVVTELWKSHPKMLNYLKLRGSYAQVGSGGPLYVQNPRVYVAGASGSGFLEDGFQFPQGGVLGYTISTTTIDPNLKPQNTATSEVGVEFSLLQSRINFNYTYFYIKNTDQIFNVPIPPSTGFTQFLTNAGDLESKGHEFNASVVPVRTSSGFKWELGVNYTRYRNNVISLAENVTNIYLGGFETPNIRAQAGQLYPVIFGSGYARDDQGRIVVDDDPTSETYGMPLIDPKAKVIGKSAPDFEFGFLNTFSYKGLSLFIQFDWRKGNQIYSGLNRLGRLYGALAETENRENVDYVVPNSVLGHYDEASGELVTSGNNDVKIQRGQVYWSDVIGALDEANVFDASFLRLREVSLNFELPIKWLGRQKLIKGISLNVVGRNLALWTDYPNFDPEVNTGGAVNGQGIEYIGLPQTKSYGFGLRANF